ncbi:hypothetical protein R3P38DRAFT_3377603 [Favolaschia claudopus]|uniref:Uncharacterized protein n=1 Tax=Favolaschia claudopus TaxID=2862362 RepID=A0AAV9ZC82_9AGAR
MVGGGQDGGPNGGLRGAFGDSKVVVKLKKLIKPVGTDSISSSNGLICTGNNSTNDPKARRNISMYLEVDTTLLIITGEARPSNKHRKNDKTTEMYTLSCGTVKVAGKRFELIFGGFNGGHEGSDGGYLDDLRSLRQTVQYSSNINSYDDLNFEASTERNLVLVLKRSSEWWGGGCEGFDGGFEQSREGCERSTGNRGAFTRMQEMQRFEEETKGRGGHNRASAESENHIHFNEIYLSVQRDCAHSIMGANTLRGAGEAEGGCVAAGTVGEGVKNPKYQGDSFEQMKAVRVAKPGMSRRWEEAREGQGRA